jgi:hypothetical protein
MRTTSTAIVLLMTGALLGPAPSDAKLPPCPGGRYLVPNTPLVGLDQPELDVVDIAGGMVSVASGCAPVKARLRATAKGTKVRARWKSCAGLTKRAILSGWITEECRRFAATFTARSAGIVKPFIAALSRCGDGVWDAGAEECDAGLGACGDLCAACSCGGGVTTTTTATGTTSPGGSSTTSTTSAGATSTSTMPAFPTTSTTTTTLAGADLAGNGWMSPGSAPSGSKIALEFSVKNFGTATAVAPWYDYVLLSNDYAIGNDTAVAVVQRMTNLAVGTTYTVFLAQVQLPVVSPGTYYLFLHTDGSNAVAETQESNNLGGLVQLTITP